MSPEATVIESLFNIVNKEGKKVPFKLNRAQRYLDEHMTGRDIVPKSRQQGVSRFVLARFTAKCLAFDNETCAMIAHDSETTTRLLDQCRFYLTNMTGDFKAETVRDNAHMLSFKKTNSMLYIGTAGSKRFGRGDTIRNLHCSEYAFWETPETLLTGLFQAVPVNSGEIWIESTGNGKGNDYHRRVMRAYNQQSRWTCHFLPWIIDPDCRIPITEKDAKKIMSNLLPTLDEPRMVEMFNLDAEQVLFRRVKLEEFDYDFRKWNQEYPSVIDDCFQVAEGGIFQNVNFEPTPAWKNLGNHLWMLDGHPHAPSDNAWSNAQYVIGVDPSAGVERDNAVIEVFSLNTQEQVAEYAHDLTPPDLLGRKVAELGRLFNNAYIVVESNNHGPVCIDNLLNEGYPEYLIHSTASGGEMEELPGLMQMGFRTTLKSKPIMIGNLRKALSTSWVIHSSLLNDELTTYIEDEKGKLGAAPGSHDDRVMAAACALMASESAALYAGGAAVKPPKPRGNANPFSTDSVIKAINTPKTGNPGRLHTWSLT